MALRQWLKDRLLARDMIISRPPGQFAVFPYKLAQARSRGLRVEYALDGGAADGGWARELKSVYPDAKVLMVEPRDDAQGALGQLKALLPGLEVRQTLLGPSEGQIEFFESAHQSTAVAGMANPSSRSVMRPMTTIDAMVRSLGWGWPDLIKLDLQGYELPALEGAVETVKNCQAMLLEVSFIEFEQGMPLVAEVLAYLKQRGFVVYDIPALWHRPLDGALAQGDFLFLREDHPLRADRGYWKPAP